MMQRILVIAYNTYREAVRARILHGLLALAVGTLGYALVVGAYALHSQNRVVADLGSASISVYSATVAIVLGATSLYRELELKTIFPILARPIERGEYLLGKFLGTVLVLSVFIALNSGVLLCAVGALTTVSLTTAIALPVFLVSAVAMVAWKLPRFRAWAPLPLSVLLLLLGIVLARDGVSESGVILGQGLLTFMEVCIITGITLVFASFSSPFLTAVFTFSVFLVGRSADTLARLPAHVFGETIKSAGKMMSNIFPNLMVYVPPRALLTGETAGVDLGTYTLAAGGQALGWCFGLLAVATLIFRRRDFL